MNYLLVGFGNVGSKRKKILGPRCVATVDPANPQADYKTKEECPSDRFDAVILSTPNDVKLDFMEYFLRLKKHVLVEKPLIFPDEGTGEHLEGLARDNGVIGYTSYNHRFEPQIAAIKEHLDAGLIGTVYSARMFYGNGTVRNIRGSWRENGYGVLGDLGCHLLDLAAYLFGVQGAEVHALELRPLESKGFDRCLLATGDRRIVLEGSFVSWKNTFTIDVFGERGSLHLNDLCKWGPSHLTIRKRMLPSGVPEETCQKVEGPDITWELDLKHFESLVERRETSFANDRWISRVITTVAPRASICRTVEPSFRTGFVGLSHLGLVSSIGWASFDRSVVAFDPDPQVVDPLQASRLPIHEPGLSETLARCAPRMTFTSDPRLLGESPLVFFAKDVPTDGNNVSSLKPIEEIFERVLPYLRQGVVLVLMSQVPPGFTRKLAEHIREIRRDLSFELYYQVETLIFGNALERYRKPERLIVGCRDPGASLPQLYEKELRRFDCPILPMRYESAELCKTAINLYLCSSVTYANTLSTLCEHIGADWSEIVPALRRDKRIGPAAYIKPSLGIAGGNLERDLITLQQVCRSRDVDSTFIDTMIEYNERRYRWAVAMAQRHILSRSKDPVIAIWGLAYKKDTASTKNSRSLKVIRELSGKARFVAYDPRVAQVEGEVNVTISRSRDETLRQADGLLIMTDWDEFAAVEASLFAKWMKRPVVIDCVGILEPRRHELQGIVYIAMGRGWES